MRTLYLTKVIVHKLAPNINLMFKTLVYEQIVTLPTNLYNIFLNKIRQFFYSCC